MRNAIQATTSSKTEIDNIVYTQPALDAMLATKTSNVVDVGMVLLSLGRW